MVSSERLGASDVPELLTVVHHTGFAMERKGREYQEAPGTLFSKLPPCGRCSGPDSWVRKIWIFSLKERRRGCLGGLVD